MSNKNKNWIQKAIKRPGAFTKKAKSRGMGVGEFASKVTSSPKKYDTRTVRQANLAKTLRKFQAAGSTNNQMFSPNFRESAAIQDELMQMNLERQEQEKLRAQQQEEANKKELGTILGNATTQIGDMAKNSQATNLKGMLKAAAPGARMGLAGTGLALTGQALQTLSDDKDPKKYNAGEITGGLMKGAGKGLGMAGALGAVAPALAPALAIPGLGWAAAGIGLGAAAIKMKRDKNKAVKEDQMFQKSRQDVLNAQDQLFRQNRTMTGTDQGFNIGMSQSNSYIPGNQTMYKKGGEMIKRADGSYSQRGLWDNIRANKGSGKKPTKQMLEQERKIKRKMQAGNSPVAVATPPKNVTTQNLTPSSNFTQKLKERNLAPDSTFENAVEFFDPTGVSSWDDAYRAYNSMQNRGASIPNLNETVDMFGAIPALGKLGRTAGTAIKLAKKSFNWQQAINRADAVSDEVDQKKKGGYIKPLPGGAVEFVGPKHSKGGIMLDAQTEVEGGETMDKVKFSKGGNTGDYIFSDYLKLGGKSFAKRHKELLNKNASQAEIQNLAKMQEEVARKQGRDENGPRGAQYIAKLGGVRKYQAGNSPYDVYNQYEPPTDLNGYTLDPEGAYSITLPKGQKRTSQGYYNRNTSDAKKVTAEAVAELKRKNPWYDWEGFDGDDPEDVKAFQEAFNEKVPETRRINVDGKLGEQTSTVYIPYVKTPDEPQDGGGGGNEGGGGGGGEEEGGGGGGDEGEKEKEKFKGIPPKSPPRIVPPYQLIGPLAGLATKYPKVQGASAIPSGRINLPRVNFNADRAATAAGLTAGTRAVQNQVAGPASIAANIAQTNAAREANLKTATAEAGQNKQLAAQEAQINAQISNENASRNLQSQMFNAQTINQRNQNEYEQNMLAANALGTNLAQYQNDLMAYKATERLAMANQIDNEYTRAGLVQDMQREQRRANSPFVPKRMKNSEFQNMSLYDMQRNAAALADPTRSYEQQQEDLRNAKAIKPEVVVTQPAQPQTNQKSGGKYIKKVNKINRKRK